MQTLIKDIAACERPYEKAIANGIESLSDAELLAIIIRNGTKDLSSIDLANKVLNIHPTKKGLEGLFDLRREELKLIPGIGDVKATELLSIAEISKRVNIKVAKDAMVVDNVDTIANYYIEKCKHLKREKTFVVYLGPGNTYICDSCLAEGTVNLTHMSPREIFVEALKLEAVSLILIHNHPSGNSSPSKEDIKTTINIKEAGQLIGINVLDHIIVGKDNYYSMFERGLI